ncbi:hypothetical protein JOE44_001961 [Chryseobacterium sp. PvR013]|uniref:hypothetical protein n=1 Tax=Chryseobacterium sp. PvR013 TaxID=2806595 RepID=UPI001AE3130D|nr:hypothetical protein [Chryseobacterium sp. PvR013]MBP1165077.1 hypothetical protein [Chryseobacterium sp. PvR013]
MSHQEKQEIFDQYAKNQKYDNWRHLLQKAVCDENMSVSELKEHIFAACDLVQEEQQIRIAENAKIQKESCGDSMTCGCMGRCDYPVSYINKKSIINPENKIN